MSKILVLIVMVLIQANVLFAADITFKVDMSHKNALGQFNPSSDFLDVAGTFNDWGGDMNVLEDLDEDLVYEILLTDFVIGEIIEFKFRINGNWNGTEEFPGGGPNRNFSIGEESAVLEFYYNDELPGDAPAFSGFTTSVPQIFETGFVNFYQNAQGDFDDLSWIFEGGSPANSTENNPVVQYFNSGTYDVTLISSGNEGKDTLFVEDYIVVNEQDKSKLSWWNDEVFYEIFVRSFFDSNDDGIGDFKGLESKLDYLNDGDPNTIDDLGIGGLWLMPIHPSPSYHGYDVTDYRNVESEYGTIESFKSFLDEAHSRGIKVIIDFVMNHSSDQHPWYVDSKSSTAAEKREWYVWEDNFPGGSGPWGQTVWHSSGGDYYYGLFWGGMPDLNYSNPNLKAEMFDVANFWLNEVGVDGFRLDAVRYIHEEGLNFSDVPETIAFWKEYNTEIKNLKAESFSVGEAWTNTEGVIDYVKNDGLDSCFEFELSEALVNAINIRSSTSLYLKLQQAVDAYPYFQFSNFISNHDQNRSFETFGSNVNKSKAAASLLLTMPGIPFMYYGEEIGMKGTKPDENIRRPMQWSDQNNAGFSSATPWNSPNSNFQQFNVADQKGDPESLLNHYKKLIHLRNDYPALRRGDYEAIKSNSIRVMAFLRKLENETVLVLQNLDLNVIDDLVLNFGGSSELQEYYSATDLFTDKTIELSIGSDNSHNLSLAPHETKLFLLQSIDESDQNVEPSELFISPNPSDDLLVINIKLRKIKNVEIFNLLGQRLHLVEGEPNSIDVSTFAEGQYLIRIEETEGNVTVMKFLVKH